MSFSFFGWLRVQAKNAVLGGISDAAHELDSADADGTLEQFRARLAASAGAKALPPVAEDEPARKAKGGR